MGPAQEEEAARGPEADNEAMGRHCTCKPGFQDTTAGGLPSHQLPDNEEAGAQGETSRAIAILVT